jgi:ATP-dependent DNA helicase RecG
LFEKFTERQKNLLKKLQIINWFDLITHVPYRYIDKTKITLIDDLLPNKPAFIQGKIVDHKVVFRGRRNLVVLVEDETNTLEIRFIHFYPNQIKQIENATYIRAYGFIKEKKIISEMIHPDIEVLDQPNDALDKKLTPIYSVTSGLGQKTLSGMIKKILKHTKENNLLDFFTDQPVICQKITILDSLHKIHYPSEDLKILEDRKNGPLKNIIYGELLAQQLFMLSEKRKIHQKKARPFKDKKKEIEIFLNQIQFKLTNSQNKVIAEIMEDLSKEYPMNRLLQGDVGSGKTIVSICVALNLILQNTQVAIMAPTEILAKQHFINCTKWFENFDINIVFMSGSVKGKKRAYELDKIKDGKASLVIGTHALFQEGIEFQNLGLCIIDEQHRFGVEQRLSLLKKGINNGMVPHQLMMSATPIPRTLSMTYFSDLEISIINEMPHGRKEIKTKLILDTKREELINLIEGELAKDNQVYWVCPLIDESEKLDLQNAISTYEYLCKRLNNYQIGMIHGKMDDDHKKNIMNDFQENKIQLLVATTVIEVGVDVPNATLMVIEHSERMGMSQLHQLRGRVGRGVKQGLCVLLYNHKLSEESKFRLKTIYENINGFDIAEQDLKLRGPGELIGVRQSGVPSLKFTNLTQDEEIINSVLEDANMLIDKKHQDINRYINAWFSSKEYLKV